MAAADRKRLAVLRRIRDVYDTADGIRLYANIEDSRNVRAEVLWLLLRHLVEPAESDEGHGYRITDAGRQQRALWEAEA